VPHPPGATSVPFRSGDIATSMEAPEAPLSLATAVSPGATNGRFHSSRKVISTRSRVATVSQELGTSLMQIYNYFQTRSWRTRLPRSLAVVYLLANFGSI
jgi:hypothetical protein